MSAQTPNSLNQLPEAQMNKESLQRFEGQLDTLAIGIPEITRDRELILGAGSDIIDQFALKPELFDDDGRSLIFSSIASRWAANKERVGEEAEGEQIFLTDTITLLANKHSDSLSDARKEIESENQSVDEETEVGVYDKYTDKELSEAVQRSIDNGFLDNVKRQLGVTQDNEDDYEIRVLSIGDASQTYGIDAPRPDYSLPYDHPDLISAEQAQEDNREWKRNLENRSIEFAKELGKDGLFSPAWVTDLAGKRTLCISSGLAKKVIDPDIIADAAWYTPDDLNRDLAILSHEYTHTQGGIMLDRGIVFGINVEELRAEHFSGNKQGYQDIKGFFMHYRILTGHGVADEFNSRTKGGTTSEAFGSIANHVGLKNMLDVALASPNNYISDQSNSYVRRTFEHIGGFDKVLERIMEHQVVGGHGAEIEERVQKAAHIVIDIASRPNAFLGAEDLVSHNRGYGLNIVTDLILAKIKQLQGQETLQTT